MTVGDISILVLLALTWCYLIWVNTVLYNMVRGLYEKLNKLTESPKE